MVSDTPRPDRCGAKCVSKTGLEVHVGDEDDPDVVLSDHDVALVRFHDDQWFESDETATTVEEYESLADPASVVETEPEYETGRQYYWSGYDVAGVAVRSDADVDELAVATHEGVLLVEYRPDFAEFLPDKTTYDQHGTESIPDELAQKIDTSELSWLVFPEGVGRITNRSSELRGYCEKYPLQDKERCRHHHRDHSEALQGNTNAMTHGLYARRSSYFQQLDDVEKEIIESWADTWVDDTNQFDRDNRAMYNELFRAAIDLHRTWSGVDEYVDEGLVKEQVIGQDEGGQPIEVEDGNPVNLAYSRLDRDIYSKLEKLGVIGDDDDDSQTIELSLAQRLSGDDD